MKKASPDLATASPRGSSAPADKDEVGSREPSRLERLKQIRSALAAGTYRISSDQLAMKLMERMSDTEAPETQDPR